jgi:hypothetical protein
LHPFCLMRLPELRNLLGGLPVGQAILTSGPGGAGVRFTLRTTSR